MCVCLRWPYQWFKQCDWCALKCCVRSLGCILVDGRVTEMRADWTDERANWPIRLCSVLILLDFYPKHFNHAIVNSENVVCVCVRFCYFYVQRWLMGVCGHGGKDMSFIIRGHIFFYLNFCLLQKSGLRAFSKSIVDSWSNVLCLRCISSVVVFVFGWECVERVEYQSSSGSPHSAFA